MELLRVAFIGNVDDGKSTLIGRLFLDRNALLEDQRAELERTTLRRGEQGLNLALLTDGLRAEREQGITIDIAYRYLQSDRKKFVIIDCPGHFQFTRNMFTGASHADAVVVLVDATKGVTEQTRRHFYLAALLGAAHFIVCVNKMDLLGFREEAFAALRNELEEIGSKVGLRSLSVIPIVATDGDNVVDPSTRMPFYTGPSLFGRLNELESADRLASFREFRFLVQRVVRANLGTTEEFRGFSGQVVSGSCAVGDEIEVASSGMRARIRRIVTLDSPNMPHADQHASVTLQLDSEIDVSRGELLFSASERETRPRREDSIDVELCWFSNAPGSIQRTLLLKHAHSYTRVRIESVTESMNLDNLRYESRGGVPQIEANEVVRVKIRASRPIAYDQYGRCRATGAVILIDPQTNETVGAGVLR